MSKQRFKLNTDYTPLSFSSNGQVTAPVVFAGYGITASEFQYDRLQNSGSKGQNRPGAPVRTAVVSQGQICKTGYTHGTQASFPKAIDAHDHGAKAVVLVNGVSHANQADELIRFGASRGRKYRDPHDPGEEPRRR